MVYAAGQQSFNHGLKLLVDGVFEALWLLNGVTQGLMN